MKKYLFIFKSEVMTNLQYIFNLVSHFFAFFVMVFIFMNLWNYMYDDPSELINGYTKNQMIWYVIITEMMWFIVGGRKACQKIAGEVKAGSIAYSMNKPYNYVLYHLISHMGTMFIKGIAYAFLAIGVGFLFMGEIPQMSFLSVLAFILVVILAIIINTLFVIFIGLFSFIIEDSGPMYWLYSKFLLVFGTLFPIEFFPGVLQKILRYSPIYALNYGPGRLFVNFSWSDFVPILIAQIIYVAIAYILCELVYRKGVRRLNVNGG